MASYIKVQVALTVKIQDPVDSLDVEQLEEIASENTQNLLPGYEITDEECHASVVDAD